MTQWLRASRLREPALAQATRMLAVLDRDQPRLAERLLDDANAAMSGLEGVEIILVEESGDGGCSVAGGYRHDLDPPRIVVTRSASRPRRLFTALHEYGHHLQQNDLDLAGHLIDAAHRDELEEAACDVFASRILLPDRLVDDHIPARGPTADSVLALYGTGRASRAACCVRAAERLGGAGAVVLLTPEGKVDFAVSRVLYPPARGSDQSSTAVVAAAMSAPNATVERERTRIRYSTGSLSDELYGQAAWVDGYIVAVLAESSPGWRAFAPPRPGTAQYAQPAAPPAWGYGTCTTCQDTFPMSESAGQCDACGEPRCGKGHCRCTAARERLCPGCSLYLNKSQFAPGAEQCRGCDE